MRYLIVELKQSQVTLQQNQEEMIKQWQQIHSYSSDQWKLSIWPDIHTQNKQ